MRTRAARRAVSAIALSSTALGAPACERLIGLDHAYAEDAPASADGAEAGTASGPFCDGRTSFFCADFDRSTKPEQGFTSHAEAGFASGGAFELDRIAYTSAPASLHIGVPAGTPGATPGFVNRLLWEPTTVSRVTTAHVECDLRLNALDETEEVYVLGVIFQGSVGYFVDLLASRSSAAMQELVGGGQVITTALPHPLAQGTWMHVDMDFDFSASSLVLKVDRGQILAKTLVSDISGFQQLSIGPRYYTTAMVEEAEMSFDNVAVDVR